MTLPFGELAFMFAAASEAGDDWPSVLESLGVIAAGIVLMALSGSGSSAGSGAFGCMGIVAVPLGLYLLIGALFF